MVSVLKIIENPMGHGPKQSALADPAVNRKGWTKQLLEAPSNLYPSL